MEGRSGQKEEEERNGQKMERNKDGKMKNEEAKEERRCGKSET